MLVKFSEDESLVEVTDVETLFDPFKDSIQGQIQAGQGEQPPQSFDKTKLIFPSGEPLPQCWLDPDYRSA